MSFLYRYIFRSLAGVVAGKACGFLHAYTGVKINGFLMISKTRYIFIIAWFFEIDRETKFKFFAL